MSGVSGVHLAARRLGDPDVAPERRRTVDLSDRLIECRRTCTATTAMTHQGSPSLHNHDLKPLAASTLRGQMPGPKARAFPTTLRQARPRAHQCPLRPGG